MFNTKNQNHNRFKYSVLLDKLKLVDEDFKNLPQGLIWLSNTTDELEHWLNTKRSYSHLKNMTLEEILVELFLYVNGDLLAELEFENKFTFYTEIIPAVVEELAKAGSSKSTTDEDIYCAFQYDLMMLVRSKHQDLFLPSGTSIYYTNGEFDMSASDKKELGVYVRDRRNWRLISGSNGSYDIECCEGNHERSDRCEWVPVEGAYWVAFSPDNENPQSDKRAILHEEPGLKGWIIIPEKDEK